MAAGGSAPDPDAAQRSSDGVLGSPTGEPEHLVVGQITRPHGVKGEVFVTSLTDEPDEVFAPGSEVVVTLGTQSTYKLIEALAGAIARAIQELYPKVGVTVELDKLSPPCPGVPESSGVRISLPAR